MAYKIDDQLTLEGMEDYCVKVMSGLAACGEEYPAMLGQIPAWTGKYDEIQAEATARRLLQRNVIEKRTNLKVRDVFWDRDMGKVSSESYHAAGKDADKDPYKSLFGTVKAFSARNFGLEKALQFGNQILDRAVVLNHPALASVLSQFKKTNNRLREVGEEKTKADTALELHILKCRQMIPGIQTLVDNTEAAILAVVPGADELVRFILSPNQAD